jgi:peroxiredoxin family protein
LAARVAARWRAKTPNEAGGGLTRVIARGVSLRPIERVASMAGQPLFIVLCSAEHEKLQMAAMMASVGAVSERPVQLFVSMNAIFAFDGDAAPESRYHGGVFSKLLLEKRAPDPIELLRQGKALGDLRVYACSMALDISGWEEERLAADVFDGALGLTKFLSDAETGQLVVL